MSSETISGYDVIVVGTGIAGLTAAIRAAERGLTVLVLTKESDPKECNTHYAQGGIVGPSPHDSAELLAKDIMEAGCHVGNVQAIQQLVREGPDLVRSFLSQKIGVTFDVGGDGSADLTREAAHSVRRIVHHLDRTGRTIETALLDFADAVDSITIMGNTTAIDLITNVHNSRDPLQKYEPLRVFGVYALHNESSVVTAYFAPAVVLATGGVGNLYLHTSNPPGSTGDGLAMAYRIGAEVLNCEYVQFHPTVLYHRDRRRFLITESLRGEGARLLNRSGERFMNRYLADAAELGPRDEVARAIVREMEREDSDYVRLDASQIRGIDVADRFPTIFEACRQLGIDVRKDPIPVVPAEHYFCGGIKVNLDGQASVAGLFAVGEVACTGVHGANRLASVSLLEGLVWGDRCGTVVGENRQALDVDLVESVPPWVLPTAAEDSDPVLVNQDLHTVQSTMWNYAGIIRSRKRLGRAQADLEYLSHRVEQFYRSARLTRRIVELRNAILASTIIVRSALANPVAKGCHYLE